MQLDVLNFQKISALDCSSHVLNFVAKFFLYSCPYKKKNVGFIQFPMNFFVHNNVLISKRKDVVLGTYFSKRASISYK